MNDFHRRITVEGPAVDGMEPVAFDRVLRLLGRVFTPEEVTLTLQPGEAPSSEITERPVIGPETLVDFTGREDVEFDEHAAKILWVGLRNGFRAQANRPATTDDPFPAEFTDNSKGIPMTDTWYSLSRCRFLVADSIVPTAKWFERNPKREVAGRKIGIGDKTHALLIEYANRELEPDEPVVFQPRSPMGDLTYPAAEVFSPNQASPYLDEVVLDDREVKVITLAAIRRFAKQKLSLSEAQCSTLPDLIDSVAEVLFGTSELPSRDVPIPSQVVDGLIFLGFEWGVLPRPFVETIEGGLAGEYKISNLKGPRTSYIMARYITEIHDDSANNPTSPAQDKSSRKDDGDTDIQ